MKSRKLFTLLLCSTLLIVANCANENDDLKPTSQRQLTSQNHSLGTTASALTTLDNSESPEKSADLHSAQRESFVINSIQCPDPADFYLKRVGSAKPLYPGLHKLVANASYIVWAEGALHSVTICVTSGSTYTITSPACEDIGEGQLNTVSTILTAASIPSGSAININIGVTCTAGNGSNQLTYTYTAL